MNRRSFLVGSGSILTSAFVDKANWFLRNKNSVVPFAEAKETANTIYFVDLGNQNFDLRMGNPEYGLPDLTFRQWLEKYEYPLNFELQGDEGINKESFEKLMSWHDVETDQLDEIAPFELYHRKWELTDSPFARANLYLRDLDLFNDSASNGELLGDLEFIDQHRMHHGYTLGVASEDPLTASLLQARLLELGKNISVKIVDEI
jgi:hypothetical protein